MAASSSAADAVEHDNGFVGRAELAVRASMSNLVRKLPIVIPILLTLGSLTLMLLATVSATWIVPQATVVTATLSTLSSTNASSSLLIQLSAPLGVSRAGLWRGCSLTPSGEWFAKTSLLPSSPPLPLAPTRVFSDVAVQNPPLAATLRRDFYAVTGGPAASKEYHFKVLPPDIGLPTVTEQVESCSASRAEDMYRNLYGADLFSLVQAARVLTCFCLFIGAITVWPAVFDLFLAIGGALANCKCWACARRSSATLAERLPAGAGAPSPRRGVLRRAIPPPPPRDIAAALNITALTGGGFLVLCQMAPLGLYGAIFSIISNRAPFNDKYQQNIGGAYWLWVAGTCAYILALIIQSIIASLAAEAKAATIAVDAVLEDAYFGTAGGQGKRGRTRDREPAGPGDLEDLDTGTGTGIAATNGGRFETHDFSFRRA